MRWLIFDAVGTLIAPREPVAVRYWSYGAAYGSGLSIEEVRSRFTTAFRASEVLSFIEADKHVRGLSTSEPAERLRWRWVVASVFDDVPPDRIDALFDALWQHYAKPQSWMAVIGAPAALRTLSERGWKLGVVSNFDGRLDAVLQGLGIAPPVEQIIVSSRAGWRKPAPEIYRHVIEACGVTANEICVVGDNYEHDVAGPRSAGMRAVLLDPKAAQDDAECVRSLKALRKVL
jgi:putative hydrolase of the HAD superfamily